jgi:2-oxoglutarate dehydrogenase E2 component (dihydrolipoamide succinyltransferase)
VKFEIKIPAVGESITEATISEWQKKTGDMVKRDEVLLTLETDKASVEVVAENEGVLTISVQAGQTVQVGSVIGTIDGDQKVASSAPAKPTAPPPAPKPVAPPIVRSEPPPASLGAAGASVSPLPTASAPTLSPAVRRIVEERGLNPTQISGSGKDGRLTKADVLQTPGPAPTALKPVTNGKSAGETRREPMTSLRRRIAERLVEAQHTAAILTTFNEIDMSALMALRGRYKDAFKEKYGVNLGFMGFFVKACIEALKAHPKVNARIDGTDIVYNSSYHVGIAVGTERGLIVPVVKNAQSMSLADIELQIREYAQKARDGKISVDDLNGGTFTITNGGVYGSLMSTPILNPPQSGILGMHKIEERPIAVQGQVVIRPMMYVALSYDHRIVDGQESVSFLVRVKECIEDPQRLLLEI